MVPLHSKTNYSNGELFQNKCWKSFSSTDKADNSGINGRNLFPSEEDEVIFMKWAI
jgi:hypothetical protein